MTDDSDADSLMDSGESIGDGGEGGSGDAMRQGGGGNKNRRRKRRRSRSKDDRKRRRDDRHPRRGGNREKSSKICDLFMLGKCPKVTEIITMQLFSKCARFPCSKVFRGSGFSF